MPELTIVSPRGSITIARDVVAEIVAETAARCYGVVGLTPGSRLGKILRRDGVVVGGDARGLLIELHVVVEHGLNLAEVSATVRSQVAYEVERLTGLPVASVEVVVQAVRQGA
ncbi:MAG TPA: Asp23/Gls24 family envelope stress response protein [Gaiellaceae bacterium]